MVSNQGKNDHEYPNNTSDIVEGSFLTATNSRIDPVRNEVVVNDKAKQLFFSAKMKQCSRKKSGGQNRLCLSRAKGRKQRKRLAVLPCNTRARVG